MKLSPILPMLAVIALFATAPPAHAGQDQNWPGQKGVSQTKTEPFVEKAGIGNLFEIRTSELAATNSDNPDIQEFARTMIQDHTAAQDRLRSTVNQAGLNVQVPESLGEEKQKELDELQQASGEEFNKTYVRQQTKAHEKAIELYQAYSGGGNNAELRQYASETLPTLQQHLEQIRQIEQQMNPGGTQTP